MTVTHSNFNVDEWIARNVRIGSVAKTLGLPVIEAVRPILRELAADLAAEHRGAIFDLKGDVLFERRTNEVLVRDIADLVDTLQRVTDLAVELGALGGSIKGGLIEHARDLCKALG